MALSPLVIALAAGSAGAATRTDLNKTSVAKLGQQYQAATATLGVAKVAKERHAELIGIDSLSALNQIGFVQDHDGTQHYRYQQTFRGVPVFGESIVVTEKAGAVKNMFGNKIDGLGAEIPAGAVKFSNAQALDIGKHAGLGQSLAAKVTRNEKSELMVYVDDAGHGHRAYVTSFFADSARGGSPSRPFVIVDADTGLVLKKWEGLETALVGTGPGGNSKTGQYEWGSGGRYGYLDVAQSGSTCTMNNTNVKSVNLNGGTTSTTAFSYTCPRNTYKAINGAYSPINDAHYFGGVITNMYPAYTGYNALTFQLVMRVHYSSNYENAFWDGSTMSFGDGATTFYPLVSADVAGHEVSHGFTEQHSNLTYSGMSGGMNEAFSDMGGEATEYYWKGSNDFNVGTEIFKSTGALRYMCNPTQDGASIDNAANYTSSLDVHNSSGVYNKAFCTLAKTAGWSTPTAFKVFARANALYWTASSTFNSGACGVETAATDLGLNKADVTAAFNAVGVSCSGSSGGGTATAISNGVPVSGISGASGSDKYYKLVVPTGATNLKFVTSGGTGDVDLYAKLGSNPTTTTNDCKSEGSTTAETCTIAAPSAGTYYVLMHGYAAYSSVTLTGSYSTGSGGGTVLTSGVGVSLPSVATGGVSANYTLSVPSGKTSVVFTISGGTGDADMYVKLGSAPTSSSYSCRPYLSGNSETCTFNAPTAGTYYVNVRAYAAYSGVTLKGTIN
ncbi:M4 family metallopeptidase [Cognatilysobacter lacus]|uniref:Peptidase n=1 Tax=Cognatilysobacter lacus TaxID=1643323 RepID=A0A5D8Z656_9GAMM|nr:M4 family metallopeptidase [Lysobacter lacus]TZF89582.1 peptidase [Lysobacter lacus]